MRIAFAADVLADEAVWLPVSAMLAKVDAGWHLWHCDDPDETERSAFVRNSGRSVRELLERAVTSAAWKAEAQRRLHTRLVVVSLGAQPEALVPSDALRLVETPLRILMENRFSDGVFLDAVLTLLGDQETIRLKKWGALAYDHGGGSGQLPQLVEARRQEAAAGGLRAVAFTDSDGRFPGEVLPAARAVAEACARAGVRCVVLRKRAAENYLPDEALLDWSAARSQRRRRLVEACLRLSAEQRDHLHMKNGLPKDLESNQDAPLPQRQLYSTVNAADRAELESGGVLKDMAEVFFTGDGYGRQLRSTLTADALRRRDGCGELDALVALIEGAL